MIKATFWFIKKSIRFCFGYILVNVLVLSLSAMIGLLIGLVNKEITNELSRNVAGGELSALFVGLIIVYLLLYFFQRASQFLTTFGNNFFRFKVDELFHKIFMWKSYSTPQEKFFETEFMEKYSFVSGRTTKISSYIGNLCNLVFLNIMSLVGNLILFALYEPWLVLYSLIIAVNAFFLNKYVSKREYELDKTQIKWQRFHDYYKNLLTGKAAAKEVRIYDTKEYFFQKWWCFYEKLRMEKLDLDIQRKRLYNLYALVKLFLRAGAIFLLLFGCYRHRYDIGTFVLLFGLIETCSYQINEISRSVISGVYKDVKYLQDYYEFVMPIQNADIEAINKGRMKSNGLAFGEFSFLDVRAVSYKYPNSPKNAVNHVSFQLRKGEIVSILGYNGSGKTTLSKLLMGALTPSEGQVFLNNIPMCASNREEIFRYFGVASQEFSRFSLPIRDLVGLGFIEQMGNSLELNCAYEKAGVDMFVNKYKDGDRTILGKEYDKEGVDLSGGEWQRLIMAASYMGRPEVLVLDEPTAAIDPLKELEMLQNFRKNLEGKTALLISHRIGFARLADRIVMMKDGQIVEQGTHKELLALDGYYASLFREQKKLYEEGAYLWGEKEMEIKS